MKLYLFTYGTLQDETVQQELFGRKLTGAKDILSGYKIFPFEITDKEFLFRCEDKIQMTAVPSEDLSDYIEGSVFEISDEELQMAEKYEPSEYMCFEAVLDSGKTARIFAASEWN
ncbi:MAG: gamma-glutamylcyclotransferase [Bacteroidetes bacterium]|nr:gamma-glutamylcyclotransferase [Bacteroidota bacterium]